MDIKRRLEDIPLSDINNDVYNVRGHISPQDCVGLARIIREEGLNNPIQVAEVDPSTNKGKRYRIIAGFRRFMAHRINNAETIPAWVMEGISPLEEGVINFTENITREDLTLMQEARGIEHLRNLYGMTQGEIANRVNKSPKWVQIRLYALELEPAIQEDIEKGFLKTQHIEQLKALPPGQKRYDYVKQLKSAKLRGDKPRVNLAKKNVFSKRVKIRSDIFEMQDHIIDSLGSGSIARIPEEARLLVRTMGWAAGEVTDIELFGELRKIADKHNLYYELPERALEAMQT